MKHTFYILLFLLWLIRVNGAEVTVSGGSSTVVYVPFNDCPGGPTERVTCTAHYIAYKPDGNVLSQGGASLVVNASSPPSFVSDQGTVYGMSVVTIGAPPANIASIQLNVTIVPFDNGPVSESYTETWVPQASVFPTCGLIGNYGGNGPHAYYKNGSAGCQNSQPGCYPLMGLNTVTTGYTNNDSTPQLLSWNGNSALLQPGQGTNFNFSWQAGTTGAVNVANQSPNDGSYLDPSYQNTMSITNNPFFGSAGFTNNDVGYFTNFSIPPGPSGNLLSGNGPGAVQWNSATNGMPANNGTLQAGFQLLNNDLLANQNADTFDWSNYLSQLHSPTNPITIGITNQFSGGTNQNSGLASNVWVQNWPSNFNLGSNGFEQSTQVWVQNFPTNISTNAALSMVWANTNQAGAIVAGASAAVGSLSGMVPNTLADNSGAAAEEDIRITPATAQQQVTIAMGVLPATLSTTFSQIRGVIAWFVCILLAIWNFASLFRTIKDVSQVPQAQGPDTGAWAAVGANVLTALVVASAIVAVISVLPVFAVGILAGELTFASGYSSSSPLNFFNSMGWGFQFLSQYLPIYLMFTAFGVRVVFYFGLEVLAFFACIVIKLLIGV